MDENKLKKLHEVGYSIATCKMCAYANFPGPEATWGSCKKNLYEHKKHSDSLREMSIHKYGHCNEYKFDNASIEFYKLDDTWEELVKGNK